MQQEKALSLDELCRLTRFSRQEVRAFYRTLKQVCTFALISFLTRRRVEEATKRVALLWLQLPSNASACLLELVALLTRRVWRAHSLARYWAFQPDPDSFSVFFLFAPARGFYVAQQTLVECLLADLTDEKSMQQLIGSFATFFFGGRPLDGFF